MKRFHTISVFKFLQSITCFTLGPNFCMNSRYFGFWNTLMSSHEWYTSAKFLFSEIFAAKYGSYCEFITISFNDSSLLMKMTMNISLGNDFSSTWSEVITVPLSKVTDSPSVNFLKCTFGTHPSDWASLLFSFPLFWVGMTM